MNKLVQGITNLSKKQRIWLVLILLAAGINVLAWSSPAFCDFYVENIFPWLGGAYSRVTAVVPFSVGECMIVLAILFCLVFVTVAVLRLTWRQERIIRIWRGISRTFCWTLLLFLWIMTLNCFIQYHASAFEDKYMTQRRQEGFSNEELAALRDHVVVQANALAEKMPRDSEGDVLYDGDLYAAAQEAMQQIGMCYGQMQGSYPPPKKIYFSGILSQSYMMGYYFPFSMEANYNREMYIVNMPSVICHELAHLKGIIQEDEANLIGYLACIGSEDVFFQYSGYMGVLSYVENAFLKNIHRDAGLYNEHPVISELVRHDDIFLTKKAWEKVEEKSVLDTETVRKVSDTATDVTLKINGVEEGVKSYSGVVELLLHYYDGILF